MTVNLDLNSMPHETVVDLIHLIGQTSKSPETLDRIVDYSLENKLSENSVSHTYHCSCLDSVCANPYLSKESIIKLVKSYEDEFDIWDLAQRNDLDSDIITLMFEHFTKLYVIIDVFEKNAISESDADLLASRIIAGEIRIDVMYYKDGQIELVMERCSSTMKAKLLNWWDHNVDRLLNRLYP